MQRYITAFVIILSLSLSACGGEKDDYYTASCKKIGHVGAEVKQCAKDLKVIQSSTPPPEPTTEEIEKDLGLESGSLSSSK